MGQANKKSSEQSSEQVSVSNWEKQAATWEDEAKCWQAQAKTWQTQVEVNKARTNSSGTHVTNYGPAASRCLEEQISQARERAWPALLKVEVAGYGTQTGFFISNDGCFLTSGNLKGKYTMVSGLFGIRLKREHVVDFPLMNVALMKVEGLARVPFLSPISDMSACLPPDGVPLESEWDIQRPVSLYVRTDVRNGSIHPVASAGLNPSMQIYMADGRVLGGPVLTLYPSYFTGVVVHSNEKETEISKLDYDSILWREIEKEMQQYREAN